MSKASTIRDIKAEISRLEPQWHEIGERLDALRSVLVHFESLPADESVERGVGGDFICNNIFEILTEAKFSLHRKTIAMRLKDRGIPIGGKNPVNTVGAYLSKDARFLGIGKGFWAIRHSVEQPKPPQVSANGHPVSPRPNIVVVGSPKVT